MELLWTGAAYFVCADDTAREKTNQQQNPHVPAPTGIRTGNRLVSLRHGSQLDWQPSGQLTSWQSIRLATVWLAYVMAVN